MPTKVGYSLGTDLELPPARPAGAQPAPRKPEQPAYPPVVAPLPGPAPVVSSPYLPQRPAVEPPASQPRPAERPLVPNEYPSPYMGQAHGQFPVYGTPSGGVPPVGGLPPSSPASTPAANPSPNVLQISQGPALGQPPAAAIEVVLVDENTPPPRGQVWRVLEIWTRNRVYLLDAQLNCVEVLSRQTGKPESHQFLGAKLGGGQRREGDKLRLSHPLPVPGTEAVFKLPNNRRGPFGQTSKVERVVLRVRVAQVSLLQAEPAWAEITGQYKVVGD